MNLERFEPVLCLLDDRPFHRCRRSRLAWGAAGLVLLVIAVYLRAVWSSGFFWQDQPTLNGVMSMFSLAHSWTVPSGTYRPLVLTLLWVERRCFGSLPLPYHCVGVMTHAANGVLLWLILRLLGVRGAWLAAALFAVHPAQVQSVAWISQQPHLVCSLFCLLAVWLYLRWSRIRPPLPDALVGMEPEDPPAWGGYALALAAGALAVLSGPAGICLPFVLLLLVWWKRGSVSTSEWPRLAPFLGVALVGIAVNLLLHHASTDESLGAAPSPSAPQRILIGVETVGFYATNLLRPDSAQLVHPRWEAVRGIWSGWTMPLIGAFGIVAWAGRRRWGVGPLLCLLLFIAVLLPGLVTVLAQTASAVYVADSRQYLASAVPLTLIAAGLLAVASWLTSYVTLRAARVSVGIIAIGPLAAFASLRSLTFRDADTGFSAALSEDPRNAVARACYALHLADDAPAEAMRILDGAGPDVAADPTLLAARTRVCVALGRHDEAIASGLLAQRLAPERPDVRLRLAAAYDAAGTKAMAEGRRDDAFEYYDCALAAYDVARQLNPDDESSYDGVGKVMLHEGRVAEAIDEFDVAVRLNPACVAARVHKAQALFVAARQGDADKLDLAMAELRDAMRIEPANVEAFCAAADMQFQMRNFAAAEIDCRSAIRFDPNSAQAWTGLGLAQSAQDHCWEALGSFGRALALRADSPDALRGRQLVKARLAMGNQKS